MHIAMQIALLLTFALVSVSAERRRTGLILAGFSALYLGLTTVNGLMDDLSPPLYALFYAVMDFSAVWLLRLFGDKGSKVQIVLLCGFVLTHIMAWSYTLGLPSPLDVTSYVVVTMTLAVMQIVAALPGVRDGFYECAEMAEKTLALRRKRRLVRAARRSDNDPGSLPIRDCRNSAIRSAGNAGLHGAPVGHREAGEAV